jgi:conjugative relaxase-like TrwC/TraI family protein
MDRSWRGNAVAEGSGRGADFVALCEGKNPVTRQRMNGERMEDGCMVANRRVFYDFTSSPQKCVSVLCLMQDDRILALHDRSVKDTLRELEKFAEARVRIGGVREERAPASIVAATFRHETSR